MRKCWGLVAAADAFVHHVGVVIHRFGVIDSLADRDTDEGTLSDPAACVGSTITDSSACAVHGCVVLPAH